MRADRTRAAALRRILTGVGRLSPHQAQEEGDRYVCAFCMKDIKKCKGHAGFVCAVRSGEGTMLAAFRRAGGGSFGVCLSCGRRIGPATLRQHPLAELCAGCRARTKRGKT
ncbi:MAG: hypothetical protein WB626_05805 [Bacteroidota bacterium]